MFQYGHYVLGLAPPADLDGQRVTDVFLDHIQEFESAIVSRGIDLENHCPHLVGIFSSVSPHRAVDRRGPLPLPGERPLQALLPPEPLAPFVLYALALSPQQAIGHAPAPADVLTGDIAETLTQLSLLDQDVLD